MKKRKFCPLCEGQTDKNTVLFEASDYITKDIFNVVRCIHCDCIYISPYPDNIEIHKYYPLCEYYGSETGRRFNPIMERLIHYFRFLRIKEILRFKKKGTILDIGCGRGITLNILKTMGWDCTGIELSKGLADYIKFNYAINVMTCPVEECNFPDASFDVVNIYHVLEHMEYPAITLKEVRRIIKEDGLLVIALPNTGSFQYGISLNKWFHLDVPRHMVHFSLFTLKKFIQNYGFEIIETGGFSIEYDLYGLLQSILNITGCTHNFLYNMLLNKKIDFKKIKTFYDLPVSFILAPGLFIPSLFTEYILSYFNLNGTMEIYCRPKK
jgi:2-polyprenyl-3-methyl-5-hydroxy-6-metoxy-1,4-benzoquinol methylase